MPPPNVNGDSLVYSDGQMVGDGTDHPLFSKFIEVQRQSVLKTSTKYSKKTLIAILSAEMGLCMLRPTSNDVLFIHSDSLSAVVDSDCRFITFSNDSTHLLSQSCQITINSIITFSTQNIKRIALLLLESLTFANPQEPDQKHYPDVLLNIPNIGSFVLKANKITIRFLSSRIAIHAIGDSTIHIIDKDGQSIVIRESNPIGFIYEATVLQKFASWIRNDEVTKKFDVLDILNRNKDFLQG